MVRLESPSSDKPALDALGTVLADHLRELGGSVEIIPNACGGDHVLARFAGPAGPRPALVLGHFDTVWPKGTIDRMPFRVQDGRAFGPGVYDMKASLALFWWAMSTLRESRPFLPRPIWFFLNSDEEIGSETSRALIEELARQCAYVLVLEPANADGGLKTSRKGIGRFRLEIEGRAAHAGVAPELGRSAIVELAHQILKLEQAQNPALGTTVNVGVIQGGTTANVIPAAARAEIDVRIVLAAEAARFEAALRSLKPVNAEIRLKTSGGWTRPPMERTHAIASLFDQARQVGRGLGLELTEGPSGGGSDGNFAAALGVPTLDGLGARGGGAHADDEHVVIDSLRERAMLLALLLLELEAE
jgi:glutamate carboxypeptidase